MLKTNSKELKESKPEPKEELKISSPLEKNLKRSRILVAILSFILFVISIYFIYVSFTSEATELTFSDINWRISTVFRLLVSLLGYVGAIFTSKRILIVTMALILCDFLLTYGLYYISFDKIDSQYNQYLIFMATVENRKEELEDKDCDFIKVFRRRIVENLILVSFQVIYVDSILTLINLKEKVLFGRQITVRPHPKWPIIVLSLFNFFYSIYLFWSKTFRSDKRKEIVQKKGFVYIFLWTSLALLSIFISIVSPFALIQIKFKDKFFLNFFISIVVLSTFLGSAKFMVIVAEEFFAENPMNDFYCNYRLTSVDNLSSILVLIIINKIIISLLLMLSKEIKKEMKALKDDKNI